MSFDWKLKVHSERSGNAVPLTQVKAGILEPTVVALILLARKYNALDQQVSSLYLDPSIGNLISVVVVKIILLEEALAEPEFNVTTNADITLQNFCRWQRELNPKQEDDPFHHDVAILVTRKDICARKDTPCNTLGVAHIGGMCNSNRSCSVNEDNGITLAHTITHEMGHK